MPGVTHDRPPGLGRCDPAGQRGGGDDEQRGEPRRRQVDEIVEARGGEAEGFVARRAVTDHAVGGVDRLVGGAAGEPGERHPKRRGDDAVGKILGQAFDGRTRDAGLIQRLGIAPDDLRNRRAAGGEAILTRLDHASGSDRVYEAVSRIDPRGAADFVVNLQGDLPTLEPRLVRDCLEPLLSPGPDIATLAAEIVEPEERTNPNVVKVVGTPLSPRRLRALYFTRATAPSRAKPRGDAKVRGSAGVKTLRSKIL